MYGRLKEKPLTQSNEPLTCQTVRQELQQYIDAQSRRVNVDSAKKRAVLQHMDYEGFRQMVLGANLYTVKSAELSKFSGGLMDGNIDKTFNVLAIGNKKDTKPVIEMVDQVLSSELKPAVICNSFIEFKKRFNQLHTPPLQQENVNRLYSILKDQNQERLRRIFKGDFDPSYFAQICEVLLLVLQSGESVEDLFFICKLLELIASMKHVEVIVFRVLSRGERAKVRELLTLLDSLCQKNNQESRLGRLYLHAI